MLLRWAGGFLSAWLLLLLWSGPKAPGPGAAEPRAAKEADRPAPSAAAVETGAAGRADLGGESPVAPRPAGPGLPPSQTAVLLFPAPEPEPAARRLTGGARAAWAAFLETHPDTDLTDMAARHQALLDRRAEYGPALDDREREEYSRWVAEVEALARELVALRAEDGGLSTGGMEDGRGYALLGFTDDRPFYAVTLNQDAAVSTAVPWVRFQAGFDPEISPPAGGEGLYVNVNDHGEIYAENPEFQLPQQGGTRVVLQEIPDYEDGNRRHMTHVAGTVGAWGYNPALMGMAPRVWIRAHIQQHVSDITEYGMARPGQLRSTLNPRTGEAEAQSVMGNTSLGSRDTNTVRGVYTSLSASYDATLRDTPYYLHFYAAGNWGGDGPVSLGQHWPVAKNILAIGSVTDVHRDAAGQITGGGLVASSSSRGPTHDGRIKPDLVANGVGLLSPSTATGSESMSGTSMASPNASGSAALLIDYMRRRLPGHYGRSSTLRALLIHTADDRGTPGPDYTYGWGIVNVQRAAGLLRDYAQNPSSRTVIEDELSPDGTWTAVYRSGGDGPLRVTLAWLDPPGTAQTPANATRAPRLVHDLELRLIGPDASTHYPFVMPYVTGDGSLGPFDPALIGAAAVTGTNTTDNVEQVFLAAPDAGDYEVRVSHAGALSGGVQPFSLVVSGMAAEGPLAMSLEGVSPHIGEAAPGFEFTVHGAGFPLGADVILRRTGSPEASAPGPIVSGSRITARLDTTALDRGYWDVVVRAPDGSEASLPNAFLLPVPGGTGERHVLYENDFESGGAGLDLGPGWAVAEPEKGSVGGPETAQQGVLALVTFPGGNYPGQVNSSAALPAIGTLGYSDIRVEVQRWLGVRRQGTSQDYGHVECSINGGPWTRLVRHGNLIESRWGAQSYLLPAAAGGAAGVAVRFRLETDANHHSFGWNLDGLKLTGATAILFPPVFDSLPVPSAVAGEPYLYTVRASDPDTPGEFLAFSAAGLPAGLALSEGGDGTARLEGAPEAEGEYGITISVTDGDYTTHQSFELAVLAPSKPLAAVLLSGLLSRYDGEPKPAVVTTEPPGLGVQTTYDGLPDPPVRAGHYRVRAVVDDPHYAGEAEDTMILDPAPLEIAARPGEKTAGEPDPALDWDLRAGELFGGDALAGAPERDPGEASGQYPIRRGTLDAGPDYLLSFVESVFRILTEEGFVDSNGNGVDDEWEALHFPEGDPPETIHKAGVELTLREVFVANLDPHDEESVFRILHIGGDRALRFTTAPDRLYTLQWTEDPGTPAAWSPVEGWEDRPGTGDPMEAVAPDGERVFLRVRVRRP